MYIFYEYEYIAYMKPLFECILSLGWYEVISKLKKTSLHKLQHVYLHLFLNAITPVMIQTFLKIK